MWDTWKSAAGAHRGSDISLAATEAAAQAIAADAGCKSWIVSKKVDRQQET